MWNEGIKRAVNKEDENRLGPKNIVNHQSLSGSTPVLWELLTMCGNCVLSFRAYEIVNFCTNGSLEPKAAIAKTVIIDYSHEKNLVDWVRNS